MAVLSNLEPKRVFEIFESLASTPTAPGTPRPSAVVREIGEERGLECHRTRPTT